MDAEHWLRLSRAFAELCDLAPRKQQARLADLAREDPDFAAELRAMLFADAATLRDPQRGRLGAAADDLEELLASDDRDDPGHADASEDVVEGALAPGQLLGPWKLVARLGEGGMGEVWAAERADGAFEKQVAVKLLRRGLETDTLLRRFLQERQILARLTHPGIALLLDAGSTRDGRPYFVMELVEGEPITPFARARDLPLEARLALVVEMCEAVDFAHRNLIVHRDLKPSNVWVTRDGDVKLLDFGIAKLIEPRAGGELTERDSRVLTPAYAAPEQLRGEPVTTATDVYALGVLLYELLTGRLPHSRGAARITDLAAEVERETVERPSSAVRSGDQSETIAGLAPERLARRLHGDLDTITLKALAREPERRYPTALALRDDLQRFLDRRPIAARPESARYRLGKFVRRHRVGVAVAGVLLLSLAAGLAGTVWQARRAAENARRAERVKEFLVDAFAASDPTTAQGRELTAREVLERGTARVEAELAGDPALAADLDEALAQIHSNLGALDRASQLAERALETREERLPRDEVRIARARALLGEVRLRQTLPLEAAALLEPAAAVLARHFGRDSLEVVAVELPLANAIYETQRDRGLELGRHALEVRERKLGADHLDTTLARLALADMLDSLSRFQEAEPVYRQAVADLERALGPLDPRVAMAWVDFADLLDGLSRPAEAEPLFRRAIEVQRQVLGPRHPDLAFALHDLSILLNQMAKYPEAQAALEEALGILTAPGMDRAMLLRDLGSSMVLQGRLPEATAYYEQSIPMLREFAGEGSPELWRAVAFLGDSYSRRGQLDKAEPLLRQAVEQLEATAGPKSYQIRMPLRLLAETRRLAGDAAEAIAILRRVRALELELFGTDDHRDVAVTDRRLGIALTDLATPEALVEARQFLDEALVLDRKHRPGSPGLGETLAASGTLRARLGDTAAARTELEEASVLFEATLPEDDPRRLGAARELERLGSG